MPFVSAASATGPQQTAKHHEAPLNKSCITWLITALAWLVISTAMAQTDTTAANAQQATATNDSAQAQTIRRLLTIKQALEDKRARVRALLEQLDSSDEIDKQKIQAQIAELRATIDTLTQSFENIAVNGASLRSLETQPQEKLSWHDELMQVARPLLNSLKEATAKPRRIEELRREIELYRQQYEVTRKAIATLDLFEQQEVPPAVAQGLSEIAASWRERSRDIERNLTLARDDLQALEAQKIDVLATMLGIGREFFLGRGLTLLIALLTGIGLWFAMRQLRRLAAGRRQQREEAEQAARVRLLLYGYHLLTIVLVAVGVLSVFYVRGDLLLLSLSIVVLVMLVLSAWRYLPRYVREGRLLLNVGPARQGERVIYDGLPFRITSLNLYSELRNPELEGVIRLPLPAMAQLISRPRSGEAWFPCRVGDYLLLADGSFAHVLQQGIEWIQLKVMGSIVRIRSADFVQQNVRNISLEGFGVAVTFGIDYQHQSIALREVPQRLRDGLASAFASSEFGADLKDLLVEFKAANASSLDYLIYASMDGNSAASYFAIGRLIQQTCVDICNQQGWIIPFTQVTVHQAEAVTTDE
jgi:hypothetical protein